MKDIFDGDYYVRKQGRKEYYEKFIKGWKLRPCVACNGSGNYDHNSSPLCQGCEPPGSGKERYKPSVQTQ